jgi:hypothetical protein
MTTWTKREKRIAVAYAFDCEGCVHSAITRKGSAPQAWILFSQRKGELVYKLQELLGFGDVYVRIDPKNGGKIYRLQITRAENVRRFIRFIYPFSILKRSELKVGYEMAMLTGIRGRNAGPGSLRKEARDRRLELHIELRELKRAHHI